MNNPLLVTLSGPSESRAMDYQSMSDFEAGLGALALVGKMYPGARFKDLAAIAARGPVAMGGWLTDSFRAVSRVTGDIKDGLGDVLKDTISTVGDVGGSSVRLVTDEKVLDGASKIAAAYESGGASTAITSLFGSGAQPLQDFISTLGQNFKDLVAQQAPAAGGGAKSASVLPWVLGGVGVLGVVVLATRRGGRR